MGVFVGFGVVVVVGFDVLVGFGVLVGLGVRVGRRVRVGPWVGFFVGDALAVAWSVAVADGTGAGPQAANSMATSSIVKSKLFLMLIHSGQAQR